MVVVKTLFCPKLVLIEPLSYSLCDLDSGASDVLGARSVQPTGRRPSAEGELA